MTRSLFTQLMHYRNILVAVANAGITWIVLIIAPLGLFAVITCTVLVFVSSIVFGIVGDRLFLSFLKPIGWSVIQPRRETEHLDYGQSLSQSEQSSLHSEQQRNLPKW
ncbi:hypothetical protein IQ238_15350 [Pleurocapsales cyanobacterium LEGE 06147]|nr:hypothetical protein [Pleurocapsales cyanobacterium LEGE 06147]